MIEINNLTTQAIAERGEERSSSTTVSVDKEFLKKIAQKVLEGEESKLSSSPFAVARESENKKEADLSIALIGQGRMRELNKKYRGKNKVTDILAFPESKVFLEKFKVGPLQRTESLGEIVICLREVKKNAKRFNFTFEKELARVLIHGILHLLGYDHEKSVKGAEEMGQKEENYLARSLKT